MQLAVWTTTPWTLPANLAVAVNGDLTYALVDSGERKLIVAEDLVDELAAKFDTPLNVIGLLKGEALVGTTYSRPVPNNAIPGELQCARWRLHHVEAAQASYIPRATARTLQTSLKYDLPPFRRSMLRANSQKRSDLGLPINEGVQDDPERWRQGFIVRTI